MLPERGQARGAAFVKTLARCYAARANATCCPHLLPRRYPTGFMHHAPALWRESVVENTRGAEDPVRIVGRALYIHRLVIDANRINTRGTIPAMTVLEAFHAAGLLEIFQSSTLPVEFRNWAPGKAKASSYTVVGGSYIAHLSAAGRSDSRPGTPSHPSRLMEIHSLIFGDPSVDDARRVNSMRDALHIDQANQNDADFFLTDERAILNAEAQLRSVGVGTRVCSAEACLETVQNYFSNAHGTADISALQAELVHAGPILMGSNSCGGTEFVDSESGESLLAFLRTKEGVAICAKLRTADGHLALEVTPGTRLNFLNPALRVHAEVGPSPVLLGDQTCRSFSVTDQAKRAVMSGRLLRNGRLLIYKLAMHSSTGRLAVQVERSDLSLLGVTVRAAP